MNNKRTKTILKYVVEKIERLWQRKKLTVHVGLTSFVYIADHFKEWFSQSQDRMTEKNILQLGWTHANLSSRISEAEQKQDQWILVFMYKHDRHTDQGIQKVVDDRIEGLNNTSIWKNIARTCYIHGKLHSNLSDRRRCVQQVWIQEGIRKKSWWNITVYFLTIKDSSRRFENKRKRKEGKNLTLIWKRTRDHELFDR